MARRNKRVFDIKELVRQLKLGHTERAIGRQMGFHRMTIKKYKELAEKNGWLEEGAVLPDPEGIAKAIQDVQQADPVPHETSGVEPHRELVKTLLQHADMQEAFEFFGGIPEKIVLDNLKAAIVKASVHDPLVQKSYRDLAAHCGFVVDPNRPHTPRHKGKVERSVGYIKQNFMPGRAFRDIDDANAQLQHWNQQIAGCRVHGTTGWKPLEQFEAVEREALKPLPPTKWEPSLWKEAKLQSDCYLNVEKSFYSAPFRLIDQQLVVQVSTHSVRIFHDLELVATHERAQVPKSRIFNSDHFPPHKVALLKATPQWCFKKAAEVGPATLEWMQKYLSDPIMEKVRSGFAALGFAEKFTPRRLEDACRRALDFDEVGFGSLKRILERGLDKEPWGHLLHPVSLPSATVIPMPRYTRDAGHYFQDSQEVL
ncbi:MAG: integrase core domain-containing protein [Magnetococcus sp. YQC-3]